MACSCKNRKGKSADIPYDKRPEDPCLYCAEKHVSTAMQLIAESGYIGMNRQRIIGELVLAQWHIYRLDYPTAVALRDIRHLIQNRRESEVTESMFDLICAKLDELISSHTVKKDDAKT